MEEAKGKGKLRIQMKSNLPFKHIELVPAPPSILLMLIPLVINFSLAIVVDTFYSNLRSIILNFPMDTAKHIDKNSKKSSWE